MFKKINQKLKKFTAFDYILLSLFVISVIVFAYIFFRRSSDVIIVVKVGEENVAWLPADSRSWFSQLFYPGMKEKNGLGNTQAEVVKVVSYDTKPNKKAVYVTVKVKSVYEKATGQYTFKGKPVLIGYPIRLWLNNLNVEGLIVDVNNTRSSRNKVPLVIESKIVDENSNFKETGGVSESISNSVNVGDKVYDSEGNLLIQVTQKKSDIAKRLTVTSDGRTIVGTNPLLRDVNLTLQVNATEVDGRYYIFDDTPLLVGGLIPVNLNFVSIYPEITKVTLVK